MKNIYFAGSIRGGRADAHIYSELIAYIQSLDHNVLTEHVGLIDLKVTGEVGITVREIYERDMAWLKQANAVIAEVTTPSLGVGYEIGKAEELEKPIMCLYRSSPESSLTAMIAGSPFVQVVEYSQLAEAKAAINEFIKTLAP